MSWREGHQQGLDPYSRQTAPQPGLLFVPGLGGVPVGQTESCHTWACASPRWMKIWVETGEVLERLLVLIESMWMETTRIRIWGCIALGRSLGFHPRRQFGLSARRCQTSLLHSFSLSSQGRPGDRTSDTHGMCQAVSRGTRCLLPTP